MINSLRPFSTSIFQSLKLYKSVYPVQIVVDLCIKSKLSKLATTFSPAYDSYQIVSFIVQLRCQPRTTIAPTRIAYRILTIARTEHIRRHFKCRRELALIERHQWYFQFLHISRLWTLEQR